MNIEELKKQYQELLDMTQKVGTLFTDYDNCQSEISRKLIASAIQKYLGKAPKAEEQ